MTTPTTTAVSERALLMLDIIARAEEPPTLNELMTMIGLPKATTHRFVTLLEKL
jgi:DNA-binding IclR family transcriptional regulator